MSVSKLFNLTQFRGLLKTPALSRVIQNGNITNAPLSELNISTNYAQLVTKTNKKIFQKKKMIE